MYIVLHYLTKKKKKLTTLVFKIAKLLFKLLGTIYFAIANIHIKGKT